MLEPKLKLMVNELSLQKIFEHEIVKTQELSGTTDSHIYLLTDTHENQYIIKFDQPREIIRVEQVLQTYQHIGLFPKLLFVDPEKLHMVYSYIKGTTHFNRGLKLNWLTELTIQLFNHYEVYKQQPDIWGRIEYPCDSWYEFNLIGIEEARSNIGAILPNEDYEFVKETAVRLFDNNIQSERYLLHGDTGVHNFVFHNSKITGVIDPSPMVGPLLYDFMYAFVSSPDDINIETLFAAYELLNHKPVLRNRLMEEVAIQLYCRIGLSAKHHPNDLPEYLERWEYWKGKM